MTDYPQAFYDAIAFHEEARVAAWSPQPVRLYAGKGSPVVSHLTIERYLALHFAKNKIFAGVSLHNLSEKERRNEIDEFLFYASDAFVYHADQRKVDRDLRRWKRKNKRIDYPKAYGKIQEFLRFQLIDSVAYKWRPEGFESPAKDKNEAPKPWDGLKNAFWVAQYVAFFWEHYGIPKEKLFRYPLPQLNQLYRVMDSEKSSAEQYSACAQWYRQKMREEADNARI